MTYMADLTILWARSLRAARISAKLTQKQLAAAVGTSQQAIASYEAGLSRPTDERRIELANALGVSVSTLFAYPGDDNGGAGAAA